MRIRSRLAAGRFRWIAAPVGLFVVLALVRLGMGERWFQPPYPAPGRALAWALGVPGPAYNFAVVVPGRVFRSSEPDARFLAWLRQEHGVARVIGLSGTAPAHAEARRLGMRVTTLNWPSRKLPPWEELQSVARRIGDDAPVLVHCAAGADRTGYALAVYRVQHQLWQIERALEEMLRFGHEPEHHAEDQRAFRALLGAS